MTSRTLELRYCSTVLLPEHLLPPQEGAEAPTQDLDTTAISQLAHSDSQTEATYDGAQVVSDNALPPQESD